jgi:thiol-disulfide isomerase/thioredoxin
VEEMPAFEKLNKEYGDDVKIVCVNCMEAKSDVNSFVKQNGYTFPVAYDESGAINMKYPTQGIPYTLVVGKDGKVKNIYVGSAGMEQQYQTYKDAIDAAIAE